jgi:hypothetical protein
MPLRKLNRLIAITAIEEFDINESYVFNKLYELSLKKIKLILMI